MEVFYDRIGQAGEVLKGENWAKGEREPKERWPEFVLVTDWVSDASEGDIEEKLED